MLGIDDVLGMGDIDGDIDGAAGLFIGIFGSAIIFFMSASMALQQSGWAGLPEPDWKNRRYTPAAMTKIPTAMPVRARVA
ncbi:hypothetical protein AO501_29020 [Mycobacterium gordonae]|uniref:Uncharacterized protein n=1 Tax=Mycobacterium gordonae TaxID=1778 RepID=A0A0Q2U6B4_MYCGO|nr:hypothetical protein AO501_29020 [Mycobacterium gordonae]